MQDAECYGSKIELSIVVPSVRPLGEVSKTLGSLVEHGWSESPETEIVLFRNGAGGEVSYDPLIQNLRVSSSDVRLPIDESMCAAIMEARSEWVWAIGDDDEVAVAPELLVQELAKCPSSCGFIFLVDRDGYGLSIHDGVTLEETFSQFWNRLPFGRVIYRRSLLSRDSFDIYAGTSHAYGGVIWSTLAAQSNLVVGTLPMKYLKTREVSKTYANYVGEVLFSEIPTWFGRLPEDINVVSESTLNLYLRRTVLRHPLLFFHGARRVTVAHQGPHVPLWFRFLARATHVTARLFSSRSVLTTES